MRVATDCSEKDIVEKILITSEILAKERAPSFYSEKVYSNEDADKAKKGATDILEWTRQIRRNIQNADNDGDKE